MGLTRCMCCGYKTLGAPDCMGLCAVCWWDDDGQDDSDAYVVRHSANGNLSLAQARQNYQRIGASDPSFLQHVRPPRPEEF